MSLYETKTTNLDTGEIRMQCIEHDSILQATQTWLRRKETAETFIMFSKENSKIVFEINKINNQLQLDKQKEK